MQVKTMKRIKTGIIGLDELMEGGYPEKRSVLLSGACGTGKSIFAMQFIHEGASKYSEPGVFVTLDERPNLLREDMGRFGWDLKKLEQENMVHIIDASLAKIGIPSDEEEYAMPPNGFDLDKLLLEILRLVKRTGATRVVIDSLSSLGLNFQNTLEVRKSVLKVSHLLTKMGVTSMLTSEIPENSNKFGQYGVEEFVVDGVISLSYIGVGVHNRTLHIRKMRSTKHSESVHPIQITDKGIKILKMDKSYDQT